MANMTYSQACDRFANLATTGISIEDAVTEAVQRIYEMGRFAGTTAEIELVDEHYLDEGDLSFLLFEEEIYSGAIGFRSTSQGWAVVDHTALYKDGINSGDRQFVDMGTVEMDGELKRKYRCPLNWTRDHGPYYALIKLEPPVMELQTVLPIHSVGALAAAIKAVCCAYVNDDDREQANWSKFMELMALSDRQVQGVKRWNLGMDSSLRRKPKQFF